MQDFCVFFVRVIYLLLWEENLNQKKKKMKNEELDNIDTTGDIKNVSTNGTWTIIGGEKKWIIF